VAQIAAAASQVAAWDTLGKQLARWATLAHEERWREALPILEHLANSKISDTLAHARVFSLLGEADAAVRQDFEQAIRDVTEAERLAPGTGTASMF